MHADTTDPTDFGKVEFFTGVATATASTGSLFTSGSNGKPLTAIINDEFLGGYSGLLGTKVGVGN